MIEENVDKKVTLDTLDERERQNAHAVSTFLLHLCKGDAETRVQAAEEGNGYEAFRLLCRSKMSRSSTAAMTALLNPTLTSADPRLNLQHWDREAMRFEKRI